MKLVYALDAVIKEVGPGTQASNPSQMLVVVDKKRGTVVRNAIIARMLDTRVFLVSNSSDRTNVGGGKTAEFTLSDVHGDCSVTVYATYVASCPQGYEEKLAVSLNGPNPSATLESLVKRWVTDDARRLGLRNFLDDYFATGSTFASRIAGVAAHEVGISLDLKLVFDAVRMFGTAKIGPVSYRVRVRDFDEEQVLVVQAELSIDDNGYAAAVESHGRKVSLESVVRREIQQYFPKNVTLHQLSTGAPERNGLRAATAAHLDGVLRSLGRRVDLLILSSPATEGISELAFWDNTQNPEIIQCIVGNPPRSVALKNTVKMTLNNVARFRASKVTDLEKWLRERLQPITNRELFGVQYIDILVRFGPHVERIKRTLLAEAENIGYEIEQLISVPDLPALALLESFTIKPSGSFETKRRKVRVNLMIVITARIRQLVDVEELLTQERDVKQEMERAVLESVSTLLHGVEPERFYMRYSYSDRFVEPGVKELSIEEEIKSRVTALLERDFKAIITQVVPKVDDDEISERLNTLMSEDGHLHIRIEPVGGGEDYLFDGTFRVLGVDSDGWHTFIAYARNLSEIADHLGENIGRNLSTLASSLLKETKQAVLLRVVQFIEEEIENLAVQSFGLRVKMISLARQRTKTEALTNDNELGRAIAGLETDMVTRQQLKERAERLNAMTTEEILRLAAKRANEAVEQDDNLKDLKEIDAKIARAEKRSRSDAIIPAEITTAAIRQRDADDGLSTLEVLRNRSSRPEARPSVDAKRTDDRDIDQTNEL